MTTIGNHDLGDEKTVKYITSNSDKIFGDRMITTNTFYNGRTIGVPYTYKVLKNGIRCLNFGFLYTSENNYHGAVVKP